MSDALLGVLNHRLRRNLLRRLDEVEGSRSPLELALDLSQSLSNLSYHVRILHTVGVIKLSRTKQVRGSTAHFYSSALAKNRQVRAILEATAEEDEYPFKGKKQDG